MRRARAIGAGNDDEFCRGRLPHSLGQWLKRPRWIGVVERIAYRWHARDRLGDGQRPLLVLRVEPLPLDDDRHDRANQQRPQDDGELEGEDPRRQAEARAMHRLHRIPSLSAEAATITTITVANSARLFSGRPAHLRLRQWRGRRSSCVVSPSGSPRPKAAFTRRCAISRSKWRLASSVPWWGPQAAASRRRWR